MRCSRKVFKAVAACVKLLSRVILFNLTVVTGHVIGPNVINASVCFTLDLMVCVYFIFLMYIIVVG